MSSTISLVVIVRNEERNLANCLESAKDSVDEIIIIDTGSTDTTVEIAKKYTEKVFYYTWCDDFSAARNFGISKAGGTWILSLDADEELDVTKGALKDAIQRNYNKEAIFLPLINCQTETSAEFTRSTVLRLFQNKHELKFHGIIHERVNVQNPELIGYADSPLIRHKLTPDRLRKEKRCRNIKLLKKVLVSESKNAFYIYYLGVEWLGLGQIKKAISCFHKAYNTLPDHQLVFKSRAVRNLIICLKRTGRLNEALDLCQEACQKYTMYTDIYFDKGTILGELGQLKQAVCCFQTAIELGEPPGAFCHDNGVKGYLAFYHLGLCYEQLDDKKSAEQFYAQALTDNPDYCASLQSLFMLKIKALAPEYVFDYFKTLGCFAKEHQSRILAKLFFDAGVPDLAVKCFKEIGVTNITDICNLVRCQVFSGNCENALTIIKQTKAKDLTFYADLDMQEIIALIIKKEFLKAKKLALDMWCNPLKRTKALALLNLSVYFLRPGTLIRPEKSREAELTKIMLGIAECSLRSYTKVKDYQDGYQGLFAAALNTIKQLSADSNLALLNYLLAKADELRSMLRFTNYPARRLFL